jgi:hypothetical protein
VIYPNKHLRKAIIDAASIDVFDGIPQRGGVPNTAYGVIQTMDVVEVPGRCPMWEVSVTVGLYRIFNEFCGSLETDNATETLLQDIGIWQGSDSYLSVTNFNVVDIKFLGSFSDVEKDESTVIFSNTLRIQFTLK